MKALPILLLAAILLPISAEESRTFTSTDGRTIDAIPVKVTPHEAVLDRRGFGSVTVPLDRLTEVDRKWLQAWGEEQRKNLIPKVDVRINSNKSDRRISDAYEDRKGEFQFEIAIENEERNFDLENATATLVVLGDYLYHEGEGVVMERTEFRDIDIKEGGEKKLQGKLVRFEYDKHGYTHGEKYTGYLFVFRTAKGAIIHAKGSTPRIINEAENILKLKQDEHFDEGTFRSMQEGGVIRR